jgi:drug/metabolite transporter (DMT)-like permease
MIGIFGKQAYAAGLARGEFLALRFPLAASLLWLYVIILRRNVLKFRAKQVFACMALGAIGYPIFTTLYFRALQDLSVSMSILLLYTYPVIVAGGAWLFLGERLKSAHILSLPAVCIGLTLLLWSNLSVSNGLAICFALGAAFFYAVYILSSSRLLRNMQPLAAGLLIMTWAAVAFAAITPSAFQHITAINRSGVTAIVSLALVCTIGPMVLFLEGLQKLTSTETALLSTLEPVTAVVASALLLNERLTAMQIVGAALILGAVLFVSLPRRQRGLAVSTGD